MQTPGEIQIAQWSVVTRTATAETLVLNADRSVASRTRTDLTGGTVYFTVRDEDDAVVISKRSSNTDEIEILDQTIDNTRGQAKIKFTEEDTAGLTPGAKYYFDVWASLEDGTQDAVIDRGRFHVRKSVTRISEVAPSEVSWPENHADLLSRLGAGDGASVKWMFWDTRTNDPDAVWPDNPEALIDPEVGPGIGDYLDLINSGSDYPEFKHDPFYGDYAGIYQNELSYWENGDDGFATVPENTDFVLLTVARFHNAERLLVPPGTYERFVRQSFGWTKEIDPATGLIRCSITWEIPTVVYFPTFVERYDTSELTIVAIGRQGNTFFACTDKEDRVTIDAGSAPEIAPLSSFSISSPGSDISFDFFRTALVLGHGAVTMSTLQQLKDSIGRP